VLRRRQDGFHEIETLMAPITLCDSLELESSNAFEFRCDEPGLAGDDNLVIRAARLFFSETNRAPKVRLTLRKEIPACFFPRQIARRRFGLRFAKKFRTALGWAGAVATRPQPCAGSTASSTPGFRAKS